MFSSAGVDGDLRAGAGLTRDGADLHGAGADLRDLQLKQALDERRMRAGDHDLRAAAAAADLDDIDADHVALDEMLRLDLLADGQQGVGLVRALADADGHVAVRLEAQHRAGEDLVLLRGEALEDHAALGLADALNDDLLGRLGGDAAEGLRLDLHVHEIAELCVRVDLARGVERDLGGGGDDLVDDLLLRIHAHGVLRQLDVDVVGVAVAGPFYKRRQAPA